MVLAMGAVHGTIFIAVLVAAVTPAAALSGTLLAVTALIVASRFVAYAVLRRRRTAPPAGT
jgi:hypothetical protein